MSASASQKQSSARMNYARTLAYAWVKTHRPDIATIIREEVEKKFPSMREKLALPDSLKDAK